MVAPTGGHTHTRARPVGRGALWRGAGLAGSPRRSAGRGVYVMSAASAPATELPSWGHRTHRRARPSAAAVAQAQAEGGVRTRHPPPSGFTGAPALTSRASVPHPPLRAGAAPLASPPRGPHAGAPETAPLPGGSGGAVPGSPGQPRRGTHGCPPGGQGPEGSSVQGTHRLRWGRMGDSGRPESGNLEEGRCPKPGEPGTTQGRRAGARGRPCGVPEGGKGLGSGEPRAGRAGEGLGERGGSGARLGGGDRGSGRRRGSGARTEAPEAGAGFRARKGSWSRRGFSGRERGSRAPTGGGRLPRPTSLSGTHCGSSRPNGLPKARCSGTMRRPLGERTNFLASWREATSEDMTPPREPTALTRPSFAPTKASPLTAPAPNRHARLGALANRR